MNILETSLEAWQVALLIVVLIWEMIWTGLALWRAARKSQKGWFVVILLVNTIGILPIVYLLTNKTEKAGEL